MSTTAITQTWRNEPANGQRRIWTVQLTVTGVDLTGDEIAALEPVVAAIETFAGLLPEATGEVS